MQKKGKFSSFLKAAVTYVKRGFRVVPISTGQNHPTIKGWPKLRLRLGQLKKHFAGAGAIGIILKASKLADTDIDCSEALAAADVLLPDTGMVHGRSGNPRSHDIMSAEVFCKTSPLQTRAGAPRRAGRAY